jgi:hypothetical protein
MSEVSMCLGQCVKDPRVPDQAFRLSGSRPITEYSESMAGGNVQGESANVEIAKGLVHTSIGSLGSSPHPGTEHNVVHYTSSKSRPVRQPLA